MNFNRVTLQHNSDFDFFCSLFFFVIFITETILMVSVIKITKRKNNNDVQCFKAFDTRDIF